MSEKLSNVKKYVVTWLENGIENECEWQEFKDGTITQQFEDDGEYISLGESAIDYIQEYYDSMTEDDEDIEYTVKYIGYYTVSEMMEITEGLYSFCSNWNSKII